LQAAGASGHAVRAVTKELELERKVPCPECGVAVQKRHEVAHLQTAHGIYEIDGQRLAWQAALTHLGTAMLADPPSTEAGALFARIACERLDAAGVVERLAQAIVSEQQRRGALPALSVVAGLSQASSVVLLLHETQPALALALFTALGKQASLTLMERLLPLLGQAGVALEVRCRALEVILTNRNAEKGTRERALDRLADSVDDPVMLLWLLDQVEEAAGKSALVEARRKKARETTLPCPGCGKVLPLGHLEAHAWRAHRLMPGAGTWGEVWEVIEACLRTYQSTPNERLLHKAVDLARADDAKKGPRRLGRLARNLGVRHPLLPRAGWLDEKQWAWVKRLGWVAAALLALLLLWLLAR
jgi:hypothetical protein